MTGTGRHASRQREFVVPICNNADFVAMGNGLHDMADRKVPNP
jgi:hypothetical protein